MMKDIFTSIKEGDLNSVQQMVKDRGHSIKQEINKNGWTSLHYAANHGNVVIGEVLLQAEVNVDSQTDHGTTPLHLAVLAGHQAFVQLLLGANCDPNIQEYTDETSVLAPYIGPEHADETEPLKPKGSSALHMAIQCGHLNIVKTLVRSGRCDVNIICSFGASHGVTPLHMASQLGDEQIVQVLIDSGADIDSTQSIKFLKNITPLHIAVQCQHVTVMKILMTANCNVEAVRSDGCTALHIAAQGGYADIVEALLAKGCDPDACVENEDVSGLTPLHLASKYGHLNVLQLLVKEGCKVNATRSYKGVSGFTALHLAATAGHTSIVDALCRAGCDLHSSLSSGHTSLYLAARGGHTTAVVKLQSLGCSLNNTDVDVSPLFVAARKGQLETLKALIDIDYHQESNETTAVIHKKAISTLVKRHPCIYFDTDNKGRTLLHWAAQKGYCTIVSQLLDCCARNPKLLLEREVTTLGKYKGMTAVHFASQNGQADVLKELLSYKASLNTTITYRDIDDVSCLHLAAKKGDARTTVTILDTGFNVNTKDSVGNTALHWASQNDDHLSCVEVLIQAGAEVATRNKKGLMPYHYAVGSGASRISARLQKASGNYHLQDSYTSTESVWVRQQPQQSPSFTRRPSTRRNVVSYFQKLWSSNSTEKNNNICILHKICTHLKDHMISSERISALIHLGVPYSTAIVMENNFKGFQHWIKTDTKASVKKLCNVLIKIGRTDLLGYVQLVADISDVTGGLNHVSVPEPLSEATLMDLAGCIGMEWTHLAVGSLGMSNAEVDHIKHNFRGDMRFQIFTMLLQWRNRNLLLQGNQLVQSLSDALIKAGRKDLAEDWLEEHNKDTRMDMLKMVSSV